MTIREDCQHVLDRVRTHFPQLRERPMIIAGGAPRDGYLERPRRYTGATPTSYFNGDIDVFVGLEDFDAFMQFTTIAAVTPTIGGEYGVSPAYLGHFNQPIHRIADNEEYWINAQVVAYLYRGPAISDAFRLHVLNNFGYLLERFYYDEERGECTANSGALHDIQLRRITPGHHLVQYMSEQGTLRGRAVERQYQRYVKLQRLFPHFQWNPPPLHSTYFWSTRRRVGSTSF